MLQLSAKEWQARKDQALAFVAEARECAVCGGTGAWPSYRGFVICRPCNGSGLSITQSTSADVTRYPELER
jgi:DnaJ-class molecular chaperone